MQPRRGDKLAWMVALFAAAVVVVVALMNGDALESLFTPHSGGDGSSSAGGSGGAGRQEVR